MVSEEAVSLYKRPESVLVVIYTLQGQYLLMERTHPGGFWQSVTGSLEWDESASEAASREVLEETGLTSGGALRDLHHIEIFPIIFPWKKRYAPNQFVNRENWFALPLPSIRTIHIQRDEHRQYRWLNAENAIARASSRTNRAAISMIERRRIAGRFRLNH